jgi:hypothetical protein
MFTLEDANIKHADHSLSTKSRGVPTYLITYINAQTIELPPSKFVFHVRREEKEKAALKIRQKDLDPDSKEARKIRKHGEIDGAMGRKLLSLITNRRKDHKMSNLFGNPNSVGQWAHATAAYEVTPALYETDRVFVLGQPVIEGAKGDKESGNLVVTVSTYNLLLNAYRVQQFGHAAHLMVDATHRMSAEGYFLINVGVVSRTQNFHLVATAVVTREDEATHTIVFKQIKAAAEGAVAKFRKKGMYV